MKSVVVFSVGAVVFHAMWFADDLLFIGDGPLLLDDVGRKYGGIIAVRQIVFFFVGGHNDSKESLSICSLAQ